LPRYRSTDCRFRQSSRQARTIITSSWKEPGDLPNVGAANLSRVGAAGHINADSGFGRWDDGLELLKKLDSKS